MLDLSNVWPEWKVVEKVGEGSFGKVYKCERDEYGIKSLCAIKVISIPQNKAEIESMSFEGLSEDGARTYFSEIVNDFATEIRLMEILKGAPNVVSVENYKIVERSDEIGWDIYIRMEYLQSFVAYSKNNKFTEAQVKKFALDISNALNICSQNGVIHRDVKPDNIFIDKFGSFKLGDFGVARRLEGSMSMMSKKGTYSYMAPEVFRGEKYDCRADIYSLGMVMYKLLNRNRDPFIDPDKPMVSFKERNDAINRRRNGEKLPAPIDASFKMAAVILKACEFRPEDRYNTVEDFRNAILSVGASTFNDEPTLKYFEEKTIVAPTVFDIDTTQAAVYNDEPFPTADEATVFTGDSATLMADEATVLADDEPTVFAQDESTVMAEEATQASTLLKRVIVTDYQITSEDEPTVMEEATQASPKEKRIVLTDYQITTGDKSAYEKNQKAAEEEKKKKEAAVNEAKRAQELRNLEKKYFISAVPVAMAIILTVSQIIAGVIYKAYPLTSTLDSIMMLLLIPTFTNIVHKDHKNACRFLCVSLALSTARVLFQSFNLGVTNLYTVLASLILIIPVAILLRNYKESFSDTESLLEINDTITKKSTNIIVALSIAIINIVNCFAGSFPLISYPISLIPAILIYCVYKEKKNASILMSVIDCLLFVSIKVFTDDGYINIALEFLLIIVCALSLCINIATPQKNNSGK